MTGRDQRYRFGRLWIASVSSNVGDGLVVTGFPLLAVSITQDPLAVAGLTAAAGLPWLIFGPLSGAIVDRCDRRVLMWSFDFGRAAIVGALTLFVALGGESLAILYIVVFLIGAGETIVDTSSQAILPALVPKERLDRANSRLFSTMTLANRFVGPPIGGYLFGIAALLPLAADTASFMIAALAIASVAGTFKPVVDPDVAPATIRQSVGEGMRWLWGNRPIRTFAIGAALLNIGMMAGESILVLFAREQLALSGAGFGALFTATAVGYAIGSFVAPGVTSRVSRLAVLATSVTAVATSLVAIGLASHWIIAALGLQTAGVATGLWDVIAVSYRQAAVPDHLLGRIMAAYRVIAYGSIPIGALVGGLSAHFLGNRAAFIVGSVFCLAVAPLLISVMRGVELDPAEMRI